AHTRFAARHSDNATNLHTPAGGPQSHPDRAEHRPLHPDRPRGGRFAATRDIARAPAHTPPAPSKPLPPRAGRTSWPTGSQILETGPGFLPDNAILPPAPLRSAPGHTSWCVPCPANRPPRPRPTYSPARGDTDNWSYKSAAAASPRRAALWSRRKEPAAWPSTRPLPVAAPYQTPRGRTWRSDPTPIAPRRRTTS